TLFAPGTYAVAIRKGDDDLLAAVNKALDEMKKDGTLGEIYQRWDVWSERQQEIGVAKGKQVEVSPLAAPHVATLSSSQSWDIFKELLKGAGYTLFLTAASMPLALILGLALALMVRARNPLVWLPAEIYVQIVRGTPLLVQIYVIFFTLPSIGKWLNLGDALTWPALAVGILCLSANYAAYEAEIHRAGLEAVPKGQREAALSLGMTERQAFVWVILPQSFRIILPPVVNDLVSMLKDSCLVSTIGVSELLYRATSVGKSTFRLSEMLLAAAAIYLVLSWAASYLGRRLEMRLKQRGLPHVESSGASH
ncbi:MAG: ABC transporter substrate-binding protein/permease, partial [Gemmataceae bacterium]